MSLRQPKWDKYEAALLFMTYERIEKGANIDKETEKLSSSLRTLALQRREPIDDTYRNINGIKMQLANVQYLFTNGEKGLPRGSSIIREMYELYKTTPAEYQIIMKEAIRMTENTTTSVQDAFFAYAEEKSGLAPRKLTECLQKAADYCHLKQPLLGMTDVKAVQKVQQQVAEGRLLRFKYGKEAQLIRNVTQHYYNFVKSYHAPKDEIRMSPVLVNDEFSTDRDTLAKNETAPNRSLTVSIGEVYSAAKKTAQEKEQLEETTTVEDGSKKAESKKTIENLVNPSEEWIISRLKNLKLTYQDKRNMEGCLWIVGGHELDRFMQECESHGYDMHYKSDGYKAFPGKAAWGTRSRTTPVQKAEPQCKTVNAADLDSFKQFLQYEQHLAERTANSYCSAIRLINDALKRNKLSLNLLSSDPDEVQTTISRLMQLPNFERNNEERHHQLSAAMAQYLTYVKSVSSKQKTPPVPKEPTIIEAVFEALKKYDLPLTFQQINDIIIKNNLYRFNTPNSIGMIRHAVYMHCMTTKERIANGETVIIQVSNNGLNKYQLMAANEASLFLYGKPVVSEKAESEPPKPVEAVQSDRDEKLIATAEKIIAKADLDGMTVEELAYKLGSTVVAAKKAVAGTSNIITIDGKLIHKDAFMDWEENADILEGILDKLMTKNNGYVSYEQLYDYARMDMQMFINDHDMDTPRKIYDLAEHLFDKEGYHGKYYSFIGKTHISRKGEAVTSKLDIMKKFARDNGGIFTFHELENYLAAIGVKNENLRQQMKIYEQPIFLYIEEGTFITAESMGLNAEYLEKIHIALKRLFNDGGDHVVLRDIQTSWFNLLPTLPQGKDWTPLLLQSVLRFFHKECGAHTIYGLEGQAGDTLHAMVVSNRSEIQCFGDAVIAMMLENGINQRRFEAEELRHKLVERGMIAGNELIWKLPKALPNDGRFVWDADGQHVTINI